VNTLENFCRNIHGQEFNLGTAHSTLIWLLNSNWKVRQPVECIVTRSKILGQETIVGMGGITKQWIIQKILPRRTFSFP
jgi:hypothetical protein